MEKIILIGSGGHAHSVVDSIENQSKYEIIGFTENQKNDDNFNYRGYKVIGDDSDLKSIYDSGIKSAFVCIGYLGKGNLRQRLYNKIKNIGFKIPNIIDPTSILADDVILGEGNFIGKKTIINSNTVIGDMNIINTGAIIEHDCKIGDFTHISVSSVLCGGVICGNSCMVGANATIVQNVNLDDNSFVKSSSLVKR